MKALTNARKISRLLESPFLFNSDRVLFRHVRITEASILLQCRNNSTLFSGYSPFSSRKSSEFGNLACMSTCPGGHKSLKVKTKLEVENPTEAVKEIYDKIFASAMIQRTMSPNAWSWSLIEKCQNNDDIKLLFDILGKLRIFRMSNLRNNSNFNLALCLEVTKACVRVGAIDFGMQTLSNRNVYGLTPSVGSTNVLLRYAKEKNDAKLMKRIMDLVIENKLPLLPGTADLVFSICYDTRNWKLLNMYTGMFAKAIVKSKAQLRETALDVWTKFATKFGDAKALSKIEKLRPIPKEDQPLAS